MIFIQGTQYAVIIHLFIINSESGAHRHFYPMRNGCSFPGGKAAGSWSWPL